MQSFRPLRADEVEVRVGSVSKQGKGCSLLLYKDSRVDMRVLDETVGPENWQCHYYERKTILFCSLGIKVGNEWVWKDNAGAPSNMEAEKGNASDALKRAGFMWGIGRELYTAPFIWVNAADCDLVDRNGKWQCFDRFTVTRMEVEGGKITSLEIVNDRTGKVVFSMGVTGPKPTPDEAKELGEITEQVGDKRAVWHAFKENGMEGARALLAARPEQIELYDEDQEF